MKSKRGLYSADALDTKGRKAYCGRFALQAATGMSMDVISKAINDRRGRPEGRHIAAVDTSEIRTALSAGGIQFMSQFTDTPLPTFTQWLRGAGFDSRACKSRTYLVLITGHWITVRGDWLIDTFYREPHDLSRKNPYARKRVQFFVEIKS